MAEGGRGVGVRGQGSWPSRHGRAGLRCLGLGLVVVGFLFVAAVVLGWSARVAQACDLVTGQGCDTTPSTAASGPPPSSGVPAPPQGGTRSPAPPPTETGQPFIPPTSAPAPTAPTTLAPATPTTVSTPTDQTSGSSGDSPLPWVLGGVTVAGIGAVGTGVAVRNRQKPDPLGDFTHTCDDLCFMKQQEAQADSDVATAQAQLAQIDQAYFKALDYVDNQLRQDYLVRRRIHTGAEVPLVLLPVIAGAVFEIPALIVGGSMFGSVGIEIVGDHWSEDQWNAQVNAEMQSAHGLIDGIHDQNRAPWQAKLDEAQGRQTQVFNARHAAEYKLVELRADNPQVEFPACRCEG